MQYLKSNMNTQRKVDLNRRCAFILSGVSNVLGRTLAVEMCRLFKPGSVAILIEDNEESLQDVKKEIQSLNNGIEVLTRPIGSWQTADFAYFKNLLAVAMERFASDYFELAFIVHNEGDSATERLMEPQDMTAWKSYVQDNLNAPVALNQEFLKSPLLKDVPKLVVNITSTLLLKPFWFDGLMCSVKNARGMYFRAMANGEVYDGVSVLTYGAGIFETHKPVVDLNNNVVDLDCFGLDEKLLKMPRVKPIESTLKLINILQKMSFTSGHDVDYYDTYVL